MMPIPSHLVGCVQPKKAKIDESPLDATVRCSCGGTSFELLFPGHTHAADGEEIPCTAEIGGQFFFVLRARCASCKRDMLLLDADFHGWNGFVCHEEAKAARPRPPLKAWTCRSCGCVEHEASVQIHTNGRDDFVEEAGDDFDPERWPDAFSWFSMSISCCHCGKNTPEWVSYETM